MQVREMTRSECVEVISASHLGRLGCAKDGQPYIVPINFVFAETYIYSFSMPGQKIDWMRHSPLVCVEVEELIEDRRWRCVVVNASYEELPDTMQLSRERDHAWSLLSKRVNWWEPGSLKPGERQVTGQYPHLFYRLRVESMTGRQALA